MANGPANSDHHAQGDANSWDDLSVKMLRGRPMRPWVTEFITMFDRPRTLQEASHRVTQNVDYFAANYAVMCLFIFSLTVLSSPMLIVSMICLAAVWLHASRTDDLEITPNYVLRGAQKMAALCLLTALVLFLAAGSTIFVLLGACSLAVFSHACMHLPMGAPAGGDDDVELALVKKSQQMADQMTPA